MAMRPTNDYEDRKPVEAAHGPFTGHVNEGGEDAPVYRTSPVEQKMEVLYTRLGELRANAEELRRKLSPVMAPESVGIAEGKLSGSVKDTAPPCPLLCQLSGIEGELTGVGHILTECHMRLQIW